MTSTLFLKSFLATKKDVHLVRLRSAWASPQLVFEIACAGVLVLGACTAAASAAVPENCHVGVYRLADGTVLDIAPSAGDTLRWRRFDGTTGALVRRADGNWASHFGWTGRQDGITVRFDECASRTLDFGGKRGERIPLRATETKFAAGGINLAGRLVMPMGSSRVPIVVLVHGSERDAALEFNFLQRLLPAVGIGAFVYDKRGTGASGGTYTQNFSRLADDAIAAMREARRLAGERAGRVGYQGASEGGWVAPLAASRARAAFVIVSFGLAVSVIDEDREAVVLAMRIKGHGKQEIAKALELATAAEAVFESGFTRGVDQLEALRARYRNEPWYADIRGDFTYVILGMSPAELRKNGSAYRWGTPFRYDPMPTLASLKMPQLWVLGGQDLDAPSAETSARLRQLIARGCPITLALYPNAEHGMTEFETRADGERISTRYAEGYFAMMRDFVVKGRLDSAYGDATITR